MHLAHGLRIHSIMEEKARGRHSLWLRNIRLLFLFWACWKPEDMLKCVSGHEILFQDLCSGETRILGFVAEDNPEISQYGAELECGEDILIELHTRVKEKG